MNENIMDRLNVMLYITEIKQCWDNDYLEYVIK